MSTTTYQLNDWSAIQISGEDKYTYLNSQLTADLTSLAANQACFACHCDAKGKVWALSYIIPFKDNLLLFQHKSTIEKSLAELKKFGVFAKIEFSQCDFDFSFQRTETESALHQVIDSAQTSVQMSPNIRLFVSSASQSDDAAFVAALSDNLIPFITQQHQGEFVPQAINAHALNAISFKKGCYMGQETVARMRYRGGNKRGCFAIASEQTLQIGETIEVQLGENWRRAGEIIQSTADNSSGQCQGIAVLALDSDIQANYRVKDDSQRQVQLSAQPYSLEYEETK
ncbi:folate-binding protein YgfZ [Catenovulum agarivorans DS-2]|uniref:Folate-binding protein YgfZ n=1 Tax=Catenovulum agarivorans DS-2 TaxID=1328313 RepID=W7QSJ1_9ALTE|nr:folate-binding protein YgfZ [Catenovulum agarivorans]EWH11997.1 folate-binding protein YgfZ [Catenovulum agarivorans DS-2]